MIRGETILCGECDRHTQKDFKKTNRFSVHLNLHCNATQCLATSLECLAMTRNGCNWSSLICSMKYRQAISGFPVSLLRPALMERQSTRTLHNDSNNMLLSLLGARWSSHIISSVIRRLSVVVSVVILLFNVLCVGYVMSTGIMLLHYECCVARPDWHVSAICW